MRVHVLGHQGRVAHLPARRGPGGVRAHTGADISLHQQVAMHLELAAGLGGQPVAGPREPEPGEPRGHHRPHHRCSAGRMSRAITRVMRSHFAVCCASCFLPALVMA